MGLYGENVGYRTPPRWVDPVSHPLVGPGRPSPLALRSHAAGAPRRR
jgi:hypothetical protein